MWFIIIGSIIVIVGAIIIIGAASDKNEGGQAFGFILVIVGLLAVGIPSGIVMYHRGMPVGLYRLSRSLSQGTVYTVVSTTGGYAIITDGTKTIYCDFNVNYQDKPESAWLIRLTQTNVVAGKRYMIADVPGASKLEFRILVEAAQN